MNAAEAWDKAMIEESQKKAAGTLEQSTDNRPRDPAHNRLVTITPKVTIGQGKMYPHPLKE